MNDLKKIMQKQQKMVAKLRQRGTIKFEKNKILKYETNMQK